MLQVVLSFFPSTGRPTGSLGFALISVTGWGGGMKCQGKFQDQFLIAWELEMTPFSSSSSYPELKILL